MPVITHNSLQDSAAAAAVGAGGAGNEGGGGNLLDDGAAPAAVTAAPGQCMLCLVVNNLAKRNQMIIAQLSPLFPIIAKPAF